MTLTNEMVSCRLKPILPNHRMSVLLNGAIVTPYSLSSFPILFYKPLGSLIGPLATVTIPKVAQPPKDHLPDYEVELVIVIGKPAKDVSEADALDYVLGYTGANDVSFRKHQMAVSQWSFSKGFGMLTYRF